MHRTKNPIEMKIQHVFHNDTLQRIGKPVKNMKIVKKKISFLTHIQKGCNNSVQEDVITPFGKSITLF